MSTTIIAVVPAAGIGRRFDHTHNKTFFPLGGTPLLIHTLKRLRDEPLIGKIIPVLKAENIDEGRKLLNEYGFNRAGPVVEGGRERQDSIRNALMHIKNNMQLSAHDTFIMVHDGARPYIPDGMTGRLLEALEEADGAVPGIPARDTMKVVDEKGNVFSTLDRERIRAIQTPQIFRYNVILNAYEKAYQDGYYGTDDAALVERCGGKVKVIEGSQLNIKITTKEDASVMQRILRGETYE